MYRRTNYGKPQHGTLKQAVPVIDSTNARLERVEQLPELMMKLTAEFQRYKKEQAIIVSRLQDKVALLSKPASLSSEVVLVESDETDEAIAVAALDVLPEMQERLASLSVHDEPPTLEDEVPSAPELVRAQTEVPNVADESPKAAADSFISPFVSVGKEKKKKSRRDKSKKKKDSESDED